MSHTTAVLSEYKVLPLSLLDESTTNPRRTFEPSRLIELAQSISANGLIQPITVRPKGERFEIVAGARRFRAAQLAELAEVPARVIELGDTQMLEIQIVENSQREDVHPYEEASGYHRLLQLPGYDVAALAAKCSKSQSHIYSRLSLLSLVPEVAEAFQKDEIRAGHANLLARLTPAQQAEAFPHAFLETHSQERYLLPFKRLAAWIQEHFYLALADAPFDTESASLLPEAGSCLDCPKRTGYNTALFADITDDNCLDGTCFRSKIASHIESAKAGIANLVQISTAWRSPKEKQPSELLPYEYINLNASKKDGQEVAAATCDSAVPAIVTYGSGIGTTRMICADHDCLVHHPRRSGPTTAGRVNPELEAANKRREEEWQERRRKQEEEQEERDREEEKREERLHTLILRFPAAVSTEQMRFLLTALLAGNFDHAADRIALRLTLEDADDRRGREEICAYALATCMPSSLIGYLAELALGSLVEPPEPGERDYLAEAETLFPVAAPAEPEPVRKPRVKAPAKKTSAQKIVAVKKTAAAGKRR